MFITITKEVLIIDKLSAINDSFSEIEKYLQVLAKSRAIQIGLEKKLLEKIAIARQAQK